MKQTYKEQLTDGRWLRKKNEILERDNYTCQDVVQQVIYKYITKNI